MSAAGHRVDDEGVDLALLLGLHPVVGIEGAVGSVAERNAAGDLGGEVLDLEFGHLARRVAAGKKTRPANLGSAT
ncbi:hypothetical protein ABIA16_003041 [Sinorhizobium fredii]